jgi:hypothetical protein
MEANRTPKATGASQSRTLAGPHRKASPYVRLATIIHQDVLGLDVSMDIAFGVSIAQGISDISYK